jgi:hypothetical protein
MNFDEPRIFDWGTRRRGLKSHRADCIFSELVSMFPQMFPRCGLNELRITNPVKNQIGLRFRMNCELCDKNEPPRAFELDSSWILTYRDYSPEVIVQNALVRQLR